MISNSSGHENIAFVSHLVSEYGGLSKYNRRRDNLPKEEQLRRIAKAQLKRDMKQMKKKQMKEKK